MIEERDEDGDEHEADAARIHAVLCRVWDALSEVQSDERALEVVAAHVGALWVSLVTCRVRAEHRAEERDRAWQHLRAGVEEVLSNLDKTARGTSH